MTDRDSAEAEHTTIQFVILNHSQHTKLDLSHSYQTFAVDFSTEPRTKHPGLISLSHPFVGRQSEYPAKAGE